MERVFPLIITGIYMATTIGFLGYVLFRKRGLLVFAFRVTLAALIFHTLWLGLDLIGNGYPFLLSNRDGYGLIAWTVVALFFVLAGLYRLRAAGAFFMPAAICFLILSLFGKGAYQFGSGVIPSPWIVIHLFLAFLAFSIFLVSFVIGIAFILQESRIKAKHMDGLVRRFPPLEVLDSIHYKALGLGLLLLTASILAGTILNKDLRGSFFTFDPKQLWVLLTWCLYAIFIQMRVRAGWRGRRGIFLSVLGFVIVVLAFFGLQHGPTV